MGNKLQPDLERLTRDYPAALAARGVTPMGVLWPNAPDLATRYEVLLGPLQLASRSAERPLRLLDLGCGPGFLLDYLQANALLDKVDYLGVDVTEITMGHARLRWPGQRFLLRDVRQEPFPENSFDYAIICGVFTSRWTNSHDEMAALVEATLKSVWGSTNQGLALNVMSKHVDWEREDLFHWPLDSAMAFCKQHLSRHVSFRLDYGLWEASILVAREAVARRARVPANWLPEQDDATDA